MRPPCCIVCGKIFNPSDNSGLVYFTETEEEKEFNKRFTEQSITGHPKGRDWFCAEHYAQAKELMHLDLKSAVGVLKG